jgi:rhodanese-related sulfurtransferase
MRTKYPVIMIVILFILIILSGCEEKRDVYSGTIEEQKNENKYTAFYTNITVDDAQEIINNGVNLTIVDCRNKQLYEVEWIPNAIWCNRSESFYNTTNNLLIYSTNGGFSIEFCKKLVNLTYGAIYNLEGGIDAWKNAGYKTETIYTSFITNITVDDAQEIINNVVNLTIVDCRDCECRIDSMIPNAIWEPEPNGFYFTTNDLLIYSQDGGQSFEFCKKLVNLTYGVIYNLEGGMNAWENAGYEVIIT